MLKVATVSLLGTKYSGLESLAVWGWALKMRWSWLQKTEPNRPWTFFPIQVHECVHAFFSMAIVTEIGDGAHILFWKDRWLQGRQIADLTPYLFAAVPKRRLNRRTVREALTNYFWIHDIQGAITVGVLAKYLDLWDLLSEIVLQSGIQDIHRWRFSSSGQYSAKSAYEIFFQGSVQFQSWERIWKSWAPGKCRFFLWLVVHKRCWTADRLARRNLPHPTHCPHCDQDAETIDHLLTTCVFARQFWFSLLRRFGLHGLSPSVEDRTFDD